jgi:hypothetical protein
MRNEGSFKLRRKKLDYLTVREVYLFGNFLEAEELLKVHLMCWHLSLHFLKAQ